MSDNADIAAEIEEGHRERALSQRKGYELPEGPKGDCDLCGRWFGRLIDGACGGCRDKHRLG